MYWFGKKINTDDVQNEELWSEVRNLRHSFALTPLESIIDILDQFSKMWNADSELYRLALTGLSQESSFSEMELRKTLDILPTLLSRSNLEARINGEFGNLNILDRFTKTPHFQGFVKAVPSGVLLHVTAGNVFLSSIDSLVMGLITKNVSILKVSSQNKFFPSFFAQSLIDFDKKQIISNKFSILTWKGGDSRIENLLKKKVNTIVAWGGEEMIKSYRENLPNNVKLLDFGPKISFQVITKKGLLNKNLAEVAKAIAADITPWDQAACSNPQNLFLERGINSKELMHELEKAFKNSESRGEISEDENVEVLKEYYRGLYSELIDGGKVINGKDFLIHSEKNKILRPSPLNRSLIIKEFDSIDELTANLEGFSYYLQSCSYLLSDTEKEDVLSLLALTGIKRFAPLGTITYGMNGAPHDGRYVLRELISFIGDEVRIQNYGETEVPLSNSTKLIHQFKDTKHPEGYIFSSGGTTGEPKFVHYSYEEFDRMTDMLAFNLSNLGIKRGMMVANLFVAGNLWSSFLAVEKALEKVGAIQLPIGGLCPSENIVTYLDKFKPQAVLGIPSLLVTIAEQGKELGLNLSIENVFYAGEFMSETRKDFLRNTWKTKFFGSSGYASVDAGVIGYQCPHCEVGEHHVFSDVIELEIVENEAVVTSMSRGSLPIKRYATGDRVEWVEERCNCGTKDKKFKLLGRIDNLIQIWSCRIMLQEIERSIKEFDPEVLNYQIKLTEETDAAFTREIFEIMIEEVKSKQTDIDLLKTIYQNSRDLKDTISFEKFSSLARVKFVEAKSIKRNPRTGKISLILDHRH